MLRFATLLWVCSLCLFAGKSADTYHLDHRQAYVKMHMVTESSKNVAMADQDLARHHLQTNAGLYGISANLDGLELTNVQESLMGKHYHYSQFLNDIPVKDASIIVSIGNDGNVYMVYNNTFPTATNKRMASVAIDEETALDVAWTHLRVHGDLMAQPTTELVYLPNGADFRLVYLVNLATDKPFGYWEHTIDAEKGNILEVRDTAIARLPKENEAFEKYQGQIWSRLETTQRYEESEATRRQNEVPADEKAPTNGTGKVFDPDPATTLQNSSLTDTTAASTFTPAYFTRNLLGIDLTSGVYRLNGPWINIIDFDAPTSAPTTTTTGNWTGTRGSQSFNDAMTYFHVDQSQRYMQSLGFTGSTGIQYNSIGVDANGANGDDNSYYTPSTNRMSFGHGCVDDNEDAFVILHEYGHAIHRSINSSWSGGDTGGMGEGFGDYWGGSYKYRTTNGTTFNPAWAFPWDGHNSCWGGRLMNKTTLQYNHSSTYPAHTTVGGVYSDELWSTPLFQALVTLRAQGVAHSEIDRVVLQAHFGLGSGLKMRDMATAIVNTATSLYPSGPHASVFRAKFEAQNILVPTTSNTPPVANFTFTTSGLSATFTNTSTDSNGTIASSSWNFGNGSTSTTTSPSHTYAAAGTYTVTLTVTDNGGATNTTSKSVTVTSGGTCVGNNNKTSLSGSSGTWKYYTLAVPSCATRMNVVMSGGTGDADLYTRFGANPTTTTYSCRPYKTGNSEDCSINTPTIGTWHVGIRAYTAYSGVNLTFSYQ